MKVQVLIEQYDQLWNEVREYGKQIWQLPSVAGVIDTGMLIIAESPNSYANIQFGRSIIFATTLALNLILLLSLYKNRLFQEYKFLERNKVEAQLIKYGAMRLIWGTDSTLKAIETKKVLGVRLSMIQVIQNGGVAGKLTSRFCTQRAHDWLFVGMWLLVLLFLGLFLVSL